MLGTDLTAEGPIGGVEGGSYLANFRYGTLSLLDQAGIVDFRACPPIRTAPSTWYFHPRRRSLQHLGLGGDSHILQEDRGVADDTLFSRADFGSRMGVGGLTHTLMLGDKGLPVQHAEHQRARQQHRVRGGSRPGEDVLQLRHTDALDRWTVRASTVHNHRVNAALTARSGIILSRDHFRMQSASWQEDARTW